MNHEAVPYVVRCAVVQIKVEHFTCLPCMTLQPQGTGDHVKHVLSNRSKIKVVLMMLHIFYD